MQLATFLLTIILILGLLWRPSINAAPRPVAEQVASAIQQENGHLRLARHRLPREYLDAGNNAWLVAVADNGDTLTSGDVPAQYRNLIGALHDLDEIDIKSERLELAAVGVVQPRADGKLRVLVGGISFKGYWNVFFIATKYITLPILAPLILSAVLLIPLVIRRQLRGVRKVAESAARIDLECRGKLLDVERIPAEIAPLVRSFNIALARIWEAAGARDRFLSDAAHELRMPIAVLRARMSALPYDTLRVQLTSDLARMEDIAEQLLDLQRMSHGAAPHAPVSLHTLCEDVADEAAPLVVDEGYGFEYRAPASRPMVMGDAGALARMLKNILHNAVLHAGGSGDIVVTLDEDGRICVTDSGPGIPPAEWERIFSPFHRLNPDVKGSGLGLHLAREIALKHGGRIRIGHAPAGGAMFEITLPLANTPRG